MKKRNTQTGSVHAAIIGILVVALISALGFIFWNSFLKEEDVTPQVQGTPKETDSCTDGANAAAGSGTFCSKEMGIKLSLPSIFTNKVVKVDNYEVFSGTLDPTVKTSAGSSENVYQANNDAFVLTLAEEPLRTGYVGISHALQNTYYDQSTGVLTLVKSPTSHYDSATNITTTSGTYNKGEVVPSFEADGVRFFKSSNGDAGQSESAYFGVVNDKIIKISLKHAAPMGDVAEPSMNTIDQIFDELDTSIKNLTVIK